MQFILTYQSTINNEICWNLIFKPKYINLFFTLSYDTYIEALQKLVYGCWLVHNTFFYMQCLENLQFALQFMQITRSLKNCMTYMFTAGSLVVSKQKTYYTVVSKVTIYRLDSATRHPYTRNRLVTFCNGYSEDSKKTDADSVTPKPYSVFGSRVLTCTGLAYTYTYSHTVYNLLLESSSLPME